MSKSKYSIDSILEDMMKEINDKANGVAGFVNHNAEYVSLFDYSLDADSRELTIRPTAYGLSIFRQNMLEGYSDIEIKSFIDGSTAMPDIKMDFDINALIKLSQFSFLDVNNTNDVKRVFNLTNPIASNEYSGESALEILDKIKNQSPLVIGKPYEIESKLNEKIIILKDKVLDSRGKKVDYSPLSRPGESYRIANNQLISVDSHSGGLNVAFQYAAQEAMLRTGLSAGESRVYRLRDKSTSDFALVTDSLNERLLPASISSGGEGYNALQKMNLAQNLPISYGQKNLLSNQPQGDSGSERSLLRLIESVRNMDGGEKAAKDILSAAIFNKLVGGKNSTANDVTFYLDTSNPDFNRSRDIKFDFANSFRPQFNTADNNIEGSGKAPSKLTYEDVVASSQAFRYLDKVESYMLKECFNKALEMRREMQNIISNELVQNGTLKLEESMQFEEYMNYAQGAYPEFSKVREPEYENDILFNSDNKENVKERLLQRNLSSDKDSALGF